MFLKKYCRLARFRTLAPLILLASLAGSVLVLAQTPKKPEPQQGMGVSTGTPVNYSSRRTVGVTDPKAPIVFEDVTDKTALAGFKHRAGSPQKNYIFETASGGVAILDYDGDGRPDIYLLNGSTVAAMDGKEKAGRPERPREMIAARCICAAIATGEQRKECKRRHS